MIHPLLHFALIATLGRPPAGAVPSDVEPRHGTANVRVTSRFGRGWDAGRRYLEAATAVPALGDWLIRRAALATADSAERLALYVRIRSPIVLTRLLETEAEARENAGDLRGAALRYDSLGRVVDATRLRLSYTTGAADRGALRAGLVAYAARLAGSPDAPAAIDLLFTAGLVPTAEEALVLARVASRARLAARAVSLYHRAIARGVTTPADRLSYGQALVQLSRYREAITQFNRVPAGSPVAAEAAFQRASSLNRMGQRAAAVAVLKRLSDGGDSTVIPQALFLAGEIHRSVHEDAAAREAWLALVRRYPLSERAGRAAFLAALVQWEDGRALEAAEEWERAHQVNGGPDGLAAGYWAGRAFDEMGQRRRAEGLWQSVIARDSISYYAVASARRLGIEPWSPPAIPDHFQSFPDLDSAAIRMSLLHSLSMTREIGWERDWLLADGRQQPERLLAAADLLRRQGQPAAAVTLGRRALKAGAPGDARTFRLLLPLLYADELRAEADAHGLDKSLLAALIRQESIWEPEARSRAGALGLMQVMPATGRDIARALKVRRWSAELLFDPAINIRFGTYHLARVVHRFEGDLPRALAAYNAGASRVTDWNDGGAARDPELFIERITIQETRDYVRNIQRNLALYRALYQD